MARIFTGRKAVIATMHRKQEVIAPEMERALGLRCTVAPSYDTDVYGTFSGEVERQLNPLDTVRQKCLDAMERYGFDIGIASEGSFGPHPTMFFAHANEELLMFIDRRNDLEVVVREISTETNFSGRTIENLRDLEDFANAVRFPSHALILKDKETKFTRVIKGITAPDDLLKHAVKMLDRFGTFYAETDMRAMYNPTRMRVIGKAAEKLAKVLQSECPQCATPGFSVREAKTGLPCSLCHLPTKSIKVHIFGCQKCGHSQEQLHPHGKRYELPEFCDYCNP